MEALADKVGHIPQHGYISHNHPKLLAKSHTSWHNYQYSLHRWQEVEKSEREAWPSRNAKLIIHEPSILGTFSAIRERKARQ